MLAQQLLGVPVWAQVAFALIGLVGAVVALMRQRDANVWRHIGVLENRMTELGKEVKGLRGERDALVQQNGLLRSEVVSLKAEVNDLLDEHGRPAKYDLVPVTNIPA
jgi:cell division protein FtsB